MKPELKNGWIHCLGMFIPYGMQDETWENMSVQERDNNADWRAYRFEPESVFQYNRGAYPKTSCIRYRNGEAMTVQGSLEDFDLLLAKKNKNEK